MRQTIMCILLLILKSSLSYANTIVNINGSVEYQTIDGFGGTEHYLFPQTDNDFDLLFNDLGASILRCCLRHYVEDIVTDDTLLQGDTSYNDNGDPYTIDWNGLDTFWIDYVGNILHVRAQSRGLSIFEWDPATPPSWMKENGTYYYSGGPLKPECYEEFAEYLTIWYKGLRDRLGVTLTHISIQNEPDGGYNSGWVGCPYTGAQLRDVIKIIGARFASEGIPAKIILPECVGINGFTGLASPTLQDSIARQYVGVLATHEYDVPFSTPDSSINKWTTASNLVNQYHLKLWQSEHGTGQGGIWQEGFLHVQHLHNALYYGNVSAWLYHELYEPTSWNGGYGGLITELGPWPKFYWLKNYFKYIRPGAIRVHAFSSNDDILVTTFIHKQDSTFTIVAINRAISDHDVSFNMYNIQGLATLEVIRTSATENTVDLGQVSVSSDSFAYTLPLSSITTFTGSFDPTGLSESPSSCGAVIPFSVVPNPSRQSVVFQYTLPMDNRIELTVFDCEGRKILVLVNEWQCAGRKEILWDTKQGYTGVLPSGAYFIQLRVGDSLVQAKKFLLLR